MKLYLFPAGRAVSVLSLKNYLGIDCEIERLDLKRAISVRPTMPNSIPIRRCQRSRTAASCFGSQTQFCFTWRPSTRTEDFGRPM